MNCFERAGFRRIQVHDEIHSIQLPLLRVDFAGAAAGIFRAAQSPDVANAAPRAIPRRASIILIAADGLGYGDLSCYGQTNFQTPNLDKLAAEGIRFTNYSAGAAADSPRTRRCMLGKDSSHLRQRADADIPLAPDEITVAQMLKNAGYHTGWIGEWNLGDENSGGAPWRKGFDEFAGYFERERRGKFLRRLHVPLHGQTLPTTRPPANGLIGTRQMDAPTGGREMIYANTQGKNQYIPDLLTKAAVNFVKDQPARPVQPLPAVFPGAELQDSRRRQEPGADRRAVFGGTVAAAGKKQGRDDLAARRLHRPVAAAIATTRHDQQRGGFLHQRHGPAKKSAR